MGKFLYYEGIHYRTEEVYEIAIKIFFDELKKYISLESKLIEGIKASMQYYQKLFNISEE